MITLAVDYERSREKIPKASGYYDFVLSKQQIEVILDEKEAQLLNGAIIAGSRTNRVRLEKLQKDEEYNPGQYNVVYNSYLNRFRFENPGPDEIEIVLTAKEISEICKRKSVTLWNGVVIEDFLDNYYAVQKIRNADYYDSAKCIITYKHPSGKFDCQTVMDSYANPEALAWITNIFKVDLEGLRRLLKENAAYDSMFCRTMAEAMDESYNGKFNLRYAGFVVPLCMLGWNPNCANFTYEYSNGLVITVDSRQDGYDISMVRKK